MTSSSAVPHCPQPQNTVQKRTIPHRPFAGLEVTNLAYFSVGHDSPASASTSLAQFPMEFAGYEVVSDDGSSTDGDTGVTTTKPNYPRPRIRSEAHVRVRIRESIIFELSTVGSSRCAGLRTGIFLIVAQVFEESAGVSKNNRHGALVVLVIEPIQVL
jgi:hypothetical protein